MPSVVNSGMSRCNPRQLRRTELCEAGHGSEESNSVNFKWLMFCHSHMTKCL